MIHRPEAIKLRMEAVSYFDGDLQTALMYSQFAYWHEQDKKGQPRLRAKWQGKLKLVRQVEELMYELRMSEEQVKRSMRVLRQHGIIEWAAHFSPFHQGRKAMWISVVKQVPMESTKEVSGPGSNSGQAPGSYSSTTEQEQPTAVAAAPQTPGEPQVPSASEVLQKFKTYSGTNLPALWKNRLSLLQGKFVKQLTAKDAKQLKTFGERVKEQGCEPHLVLDHCLQQWSAFIWEAKFQKGLPSVPEQPVIGFLLAHYEVACRYFEASSKPSASPTTSQATTISPEPVVPSPPAEEPLATADEVAEVMSKL